MVVLAIMCNNLFPFSLAISDAWEHSDLCAYLSPAFLMSSYYY